MIWDRVPKLSCILLVGRIDRPDDAILFFDNFFSSVKLSTYLKEELNILSVGTVCRNRMENCPFTDDKDMEKLG